LSKTKVSNKKYQCNAVNTCGNRMCKLSFSNTWKYFLGQDIQMFFETFESPWIFERKMQRWGSLPSRWSVLRWRMRTRPPPSRWRGSCRRRRRRTWRRRSRCSSLPCKGSIRWFCYKSRSGVISWIYMYLNLVKADSSLISADIFSWTWQLCALSVFFLSRVN